MTIAPQDYVRQYNELLTNQADYVKKYSGENPGGRITRFLSHA